jgi:hypothetical protein
MEWLDAFRGTVVALDTAPLIYLIEENPIYLPIVRPFFERLDLGEFRVVTSVVTLAEVLVHPMRQGDHELAMSTDESSFTRAMSQRCLYLRRSPRRRPSYALGMAYECPTPSNWRRRLARELVPFDQWRPAPQLGLSDADGPETTHYNATLTSTQISMIAAPLGPSARACA